MGTKKALGQTMQVHSVKVGLTSPSESSGKQVGSKDKGGNKGKQSQNIGFSPLLNEKHL